MPATRVKRRYVAFKVLEPSCSSKPELYNSIAQTFSELRDMPSVQSSDFRIIDYDPSTSAGIIRCSHLHVDALQATLKSMKIRETPARVEVLTVSGTLKALRSRLCKPQA